MNEFDMEQPTGPTPRAMWSWVEQGSSLSTAEEPLTLRPNLGVRPNRPHTMFS